MSRRGWAAKFADAFRGVWLAVREERSFRVHLPMAAAVVGLAVLLRCDWLEWCVLVGCVGAVLAAETFNSALEALFHAASELLVMPIQDVFGWSDRINQPATVHEGNWSVKLPWPVDRLDAVPEARARQDRLRQWARASGRA